MPITPNAQVPIPERWGARTVGVASARLEVAGLGCV